MKRSEDRFTDSTGGSSPPTEEKRRDLRRLVALEWTQTTFGVGLLVAVAARAVYMAHDDAVAAAITLAGILAMIFLAMALRIRMGHEALRRDLERIEIRHEIEQGSCGPHSGSPYRDRIVARQLQLVPTRRAARLRRWLARLLERRRVHVQVREHRLRSR